MTGSVCGRRGISEFETHKKVFFFLMLRLVEQVLAIQFGPDLVTCDSMIVREETPWHV